MAARAIQEKTREPEVRVYKARGGAAQLFRSRDFEVLLEGPTNTGKTRAALEKANALCEKYPGIRVLFLRQTRKSLSESVLVTWEEKVLWGGHPCITGKATKANRHSYTYPRARNEVDGVTYDGESHIVLGGLDHPARFMSTEFDVIILFEATEATVGAWEKLITRCRNKVMPYQQLIADCNPADEYHWLNTRAEDPMVVPAELKGLVPPPRPGQKMLSRILSRHVDNPSFGPTDRMRLEGLQGASRARYLDGKWVSESGQIWEPYDRAIHVVSADEFKKDSHMWLRIVKPNWTGPEDNHEEVRLCYFFGSMDWGHRAPGVFQAWAVDEHERLFRLAEIYMTRKNIDWWADKICELDQRYSFERIVCDPEEPGNIEILNQRIGDARGRHMGRIADKAINDWTAGVNEVRQALSDHALFFVADAFPFGTDADLKSRRLPFCTEQEIPSYIWMQTQDGKPVEEKPDKRCADHGCDSTRYAKMHVAFRNKSFMLEPSLWPPGTYGHWLGHNEFDPNVEEDN